MDRIYLKLIWQIPYNTAESIQPMWLTPNWFLIKPILALFLTSLALLMLLASVYYVLIQLFSEVSSTFLRKISKKGRRNVEETHKEVWE